MLLRFAKRDLCLDLQSRIDAGSLSRSVGFKKMKSFVRRQSDLQKKSADNSITEIYFNGFGLLRNSTLQYQPWFKS